MFCTKCGEANQDGDKFCHQCGARLGRSGAAEKLIAAGTMAPAIAAPPATASGSAAPTPGGVASGLRQAGGTVWAESLAPGQILAGRYEIQEQLGAGGMGQVWKAQDRELGLPVAVKLLPPLLAGNARAVAAMKGEAALLLKLTHLHICRLYNFHSEAGLGFLVMELIAGRTLEQLLDEKPDRRMSLDEALPIFAAAASALDFAHSQQPPILHRDIKPANIMVDEQGLVKVMDFGIACEIRDKLTQVTGQVPLGTLLYMSPEQYRGKALRPGSDLYSLAASLYEALCGHPPFQAGAIGHQLLNEQPAPLRELAVSIAEGMDQVVLKALAKLPEERFDSCGDWWTALQQAHGDGGRNRPVEADGNGGPPQATSEDFLGSAVSLYRQGDFDGAREVLDAVIRAQPDNADAYYWRGLVREAKQDDYRALADYSEALERKPGAALSWSCRARVFGRLGKHENAIADFTEAIGLDPTADLYLARGNEYHAMRQWDQACADYHHVLRLEPDSWAARYNLGLVGECTDKLQDAIGHYTQCIRLAPHDQNPLGRRGAIYLLADDFAAGAKDLNAIEARQAEAGGSALAEDRYRCAVRRLLSSGYPVTRLVFSHDANYLFAATGTAGTTTAEPAVLWDLSTGTQVSRLQAPPESFAFIDSAAFSMDSRTLFLARSDEGVSHVSSWDLETGANRDHFQLDRSIVERHGTSLSPDGRYTALSRGQDHIIYVFDNRTQQIVKRCVGHTDKPKVWGFSGNGQRLLTFQGRGPGPEKWYLWDLASGLALMNHETCGVHALSADGRRMVVEVKTGGPVDGLGILDTESGRLDAIPAAACFGGAISADGRYVVYGEPLNILLSSLLNRNVNHPSLCKGRFVLKMMDVERKELVRVFLANVGFITGMAFSDEGRLFASAAEDYRSSTVEVRLWETGL